jgi:hypothetical protein
MHLGVTTFSIHNTSPPDEIACVVRDAGADIIVSEQAFADTLRKAGIEPDRILLVDGERSLEAVAARARRLRLRRDVDPRRAR